MQVSFTRVQWRITERFFITVIPTRQNQLWNIWNILNRKHWHTGGNSSAWHRYRPWFCCIAADNDRRQTNAWNDSLRKIRTSDRLSKQFMKESYRFAAAIGLALRAKWGLLPANSASFHWVCARFIRPPNDRSCETNHLWYSIEPYRLWRLGCVDLLLAAEVLDWKRLAAVSSVLLS